MSRRPRVAVYAIALDEAPFCERFCVSCSGADVVLVADTGSSDGTPERLRTLGASVHQIRIRPWRFDVARNAALALLPADVDVCISLDLDEVLAEGWRAALDRAWDPAATQFRNRLVWNWKPDGSPGLTYLASRIHARAGFAWIYPCHEVLHYYGDQVQRVVDVPGLEIHHRADSRKSRGQYLELLALGAREYPLAARPAFNYGRELYFYQRWQEAIAELQRYLALPDSTSPEQRSQAMIYLARCSSGLGRADEALRWTLRSAAEAPGRREPWCELAEISYRLRDWEQSYAASLRALKIEERAESWLGEHRAWGALPHDLAAVAASNMGMHQQAYEHGLAALDLEPDDPRLQANAAFYRQAWDPPAQEKGMALAPPAPASEEWPLLFQIGVDAYYRGEPELGRAACESLLSLEGPPNGVVWQTRRNQVFYAQRLEDLVPSCRMSAVCFPVPEGWSRFNPSIAVGDDGCRMIVRSSNYEMDRGVYTIHADDRVIRTKNYLLSLDRDQSITSVDAIDGRPGKGRTFPFPVHGFEDCRLFRHAGSWCVTATTREHNPAGICQIAMLRLADGAFRDLRLLSDAGRHEKNWVPLSVDRDLFFIYSFRPTIVLRYAEAKGRVSEVTHAPGPPIAANFRGGSQAIAVPGGFLCLVHEPVLFEDGSRVYLHRFVLLDRNFAITHVSPQFYFRERGVEYCAGLAVDDRRLIASFGFRDREAYLASMDLDAALASLRPVG